MSPREAESGRASRGPAGAGQVGPGQGVGGQVVAGEGAAGKVVAGKGAAGKVAEGLPVAGRRGVLTPRRPPDPAVRDGERSDSGRLAKPQRQHRIARLLEQHAVGSQARLVELLSGEGVLATQATVSRDLEDMGAVKVRVPGGDLVYAIPELPREQIAPEDHLRRVFGEWVVEVAWSANLVVLRTPPGSAHVVASALDRAALDGVIGTVAGDDTILVVSSERVGGTALAERLRRLAGL